MSDVPPLPCPSATSPPTSPSRTRTAWTSPSARSVATKNVVLVFFPFAFSGICTGELCEIRDNLGAFVSDKVQVLAISCDPMYAQRGFADKEGYFFPLLSDFWPHGAVAQEYGVFNDAGRPRRCGARSSSTPRGRSVGPSSTRPAPPATSAATTTALGCARPWSGRDTMTAGTAGPTSGARGPVAQLVEHRAYTAVVVGSNPAGPTWTLTLRDVVAALERLYPPATAQSWDRVGLVTGDLDQPVTRIHLALDPTLAVIEEARAAQADLLITHHPLLLRGVQQRGDDDGQGGERDEPRRRRHRPLRRPHQRRRRHPGRERRPRRGVRARRAPSRSPSSRASRSAGSGDLAEPMTLADLAARLREALPPAAGRHPGGRSRRRPRSVGWP